MRQPGLLEDTRPFRPYPFAGDTFNPERDGPRLSAQLDRVAALMADGRWRTLREIATLVQGSEPSVSARLRDLRKPQFGGCVVERRYLADGVWTYRVTGCPR